MAKKSEPEPTTEETLTIELYSSDICPHCDEIKQILEPYIKDGTVTVIDIYDLDDEGVRFCRSIGLEDVPTFVVNKTKCEHDVTENGVTIVVEDLGEIELNLE